MNIPNLTTDRVTVRLGHLPDVPTVLAYWQDNGHRYHPPLPPELLTEHHWAEQLLRNHKACVEDTSYVLCVFEGHQMIGGISLSQVTRGWRHSCRLGYGIAATHEGQGYMYEAVSATINWAFTALNMHRIEAHFSTDNARSGRLLERLGFEREGRMREFHYAGGRWHDQVLTSLLNVNWTPPAG